MIAMPKKSMIVLEAETIIENVIITWKKNFYTGNGIHF